MVPAEGAQVKMLVSRARDVARHWIHEEGSQLPGFRGAFLIGSVNWLAGDDALEPGSDVDVMVLVDDPEAVRRPGKILADGVILEISLSPADAFASADTILGDYHAAPSFQNTTILADPNGVLARVREEVARHYPEDRWVRRRVQDARFSIERMVSPRRADATFPDRVPGLAFGAGVMTHVLLTAGLRNPTVRKRYVAVQDLLHDRHMLDTHERLLEIAGFAAMRREQVEAHLRALTDVFNLAAPLAKSPYRFASDITELSRPIAIDGTWDMIRAGHHRESLFWIVATWGRCQNVLAADATPEVLAWSTSGYRALALDIGLGDHNAMERRAVDILAALPWLDEVGGQVIATTPEIVRG